MMGVCGGLGWGLLWVVWMYGNDLGKMVGLLYCCVYKLW